MKILDEQTRIKVIPETPEKRDYLILSTNESNYERYTELTKKQPMKELGLALAESRTLYDVMTWTGKDRNTFLGLQLKRQ